MQFMTREEAIKHLKEQATNWDKEEAHGKADDILIAYLRELGENELVEAWRKVPKWYA
jgi:hypothetical protein